MAPLGLGLIKIIAQNLVHKLRPRNLHFLGLPPSELLVIVRDGDLLVDLWERPRAQFTFEFTTRTHIALGNVALLAKRLMVAEFVGAVANARFLVIRAKSHIWLLGSAICALVTVLCSELVPISRLQFGSWLALLAYLQVLHLIAIAFFYNASEPFVTLQFPHSAKRVFIRFLAFCGAEAINQCTNVILTKGRPRYAMTFWPKGLEDGQVIGFVHGCRSYKIALGFGQPPFSAGCRFI